MIKNKSNPYSCSQIIGDYVYALYSTEDVFLHTKRLLRVCKYIKLWLAHAMLPDLGIRIPE